MSDLTPALADRLAALALSHATREYPNKPDHVQNGPEDVRTPRELHPLFYGSFDWHSNVHAYWLLATLYRTVPALPCRGEIRQLLDTQITPKNVAGELAYLSQPLRGTFERPYGWAWMLKLGAELARQDAPWAATLEPLTKAFADRFRRWLPNQTYPVRAGVHSNTAFAIALALDYRNEPLGATLRTKAREWYGEDAGCQAWEPSGDDFLSPALVEAECMRRVLPVEQWRAWFSAFLPDVARQKPPTLFHPAVVSDRTDGKIAHLDGLNLSRAWCWRSIASTLSPDDPRHAVALEAATRHLDASLPQIAGDYMGEHWLATFALLALGEISSTPGSE